MAGTIVDTRQTLLNTCTLIAITITRYENYSFPEIAQDCFRLSVTINRSYTAVSCVLSIAKHWNTYVIPGNELVYQLIHVYQIKNLLMDMTDCYWSKTGSIKRGLTVLIKFLTLNQWIIITFVSTKALGKFNSLVKNWKFNTIKRGLDSRHSRLLGGYEILYPPPQKLGGPSPCPPKSPPVDFRPSDPLDHLCTCRTFKP